MWSVVWKRSWEEMREEEREDEREKREGMKRERLRIRERKEVGISVKRNDRAIR